MKKFISTVRNIFSIEDLRVRIVNTIGFLIIFRLGSFIVLPGVDPSKLGSAPEGIFGLIDTFLGGAFSNASIFGLGIMPYISASIVVQLMGIAVPYLQKLQKVRLGETLRTQLGESSLSTFLSWGGSPFESSLVLYSWSRSMMSLTACFTISPFVTESATRITASWTSSVL